MAIGTGLVAVSKKGLAGSVEVASTVEPLGVREAGIRSLIRQRLNQDAEAAPSRPHAYHTDSHSVQWEEERSAAAAVGGCSPGGEQTARLAGPTMPLEDKQSSFHTEPHLPSIPSLPQGPASGAAADMTEASSAGAKRMASESGHDNNEVQGADCTGCDIDRMPTLLQRPQLLQKTCDNQGTTSIGHAGNPDGFAVAVSGRLKAAAPHYAEAIRPEQQQLALASGQPHAHLPMPFSHLLCLWAIKLVLPHPVTQKVLKLGIPDPPVFDQVRTAEARLARQANSVKD
ncbi:hypothetical protein ABBQ38_011923 [Trebouxia sp. C0009 RCD-2024]